MMIKETWRQKNEDNAEEDGTCTEDDKNDEEDRV
jgi:hypothetical protein